MLDFSGRVVATLLGVTLIGAAVAAEFQPGALATLIEQTPDYARRIVENALARENVLHVASAALALCGLFVTVSSWPLLIAGVILLGRAAVSTVGIALIAVAIVLAIDPTFFGLFVEVPPIDDEEGGGGVGIVIQSAAVLLALIGFAVTTAPWRRGG